MGSLRNRQENMQETITYYCTAHVDRWEVDCGSLQSLGEHMAARANTRTAD
jgi:hypothetical protein